MDAITQKIQETRSIGLTAHQSETHQCIAVEYQRLSDNAEPALDDRFSQATFAGVARLALTATCTSLSKSLGSSMATWLSILRFSSTPACLRPFMTKL